VHAEGGLATVVDVVVVDVVVLVVVVVGFSVVVVGFSVVVVGFSVVVVGSSVVVVESCLMVVVSWAELGDPMVAVAATTPSVMVVAAMAASRAFGCRPIDSSW
jgi:hypothetical protein